MSNANFEITAQGYEELKNELDNLKNVKRVEVINALKEARALGDLSENADYDAARNDQAQIEGKIKELEYKLEHCIIVGKKNSSVGVGNVVTIKDDLGEEEEYTIVSSVEADPFNNKISVESPLGSAMKGHKKGDIVKVELDEDSYEIEILNIA